MQGMQNGVKMQIKHKQVSGNTLKKMSALVLMGLFCVGCANSKTQSPTQSNTQAIDALGQRVSTIEGRVLALGLEVKAGQEQVYEVRNRRGQKTGMTAHPTAQTAQGPAPVAYVSPKTNTQPRAVAPRPSTSAPAATAATGATAAVVPAPNTSPKAPMGKLDPNSGLQKADSTKQTLTAGDNLALPPETAVYTPAAQNNMPNSSAAPKSAGIVASQAPQMPPAGAPLLPPQERAQPYSPTAPQSAAAAAPAPAVAGEKGAYSQALNLVRSGQYQAGRDRFQAFLSTYPQSSLVPNAYYWIGESFYAQGNFNDALAAFKYITTNYPRHHKSPDALLKAGMTYQRLGDVENAKVHYQTLVSTFPRSNAARVARSKKL